MLLICTDSDNLFFHDVNTIQYNTIQYNTTQHNTTQHNTIQYNTIQYNTIQYNTIQYNTVQYNTIQYNTIQYNIGIYKAPFPKDAKSKKQYRNTHPPTHPHTQIFYKNRYKKMKRNNAK